MKTKICTKCEIEFPAIAEHFFKERHGKYGLRSKCKPCFQAEVKGLKAKPEYRQKAIEHGRQYYQKNKDRAAERWQRYYEVNAEHLREKARDWGRANLERRRIADRKRRANVGFRVSQNISRSIRQSLFRFNGKGGAPWESLVDYTKEDLVKHLEKQFQPGMTWDNYGKWHIDHEIPISAFNFTKPEHEDFVRCWSLNNLRPMWAKENISKGARLEKPFQPRLQMEVT